VAICVISVNRLSSEIYVYFKKKKKVPLEKSPAAEEEGTPCPAYTAVSSRTCRTISNK
jgi:hypothetical protein